MVRRKSFGSGAGLSRHGSVPLLYGAIALLSTAPGIYLFAM